MFKFAESSADTADNIDKMSQKIGISREAYQELDFACSQSGASVDGLKAGLKTLTAQMDKASQGNADTAEKFEQLGVSVTNADGSLRSQEEVLFDTLSALQDVENQTEKSRLATELLGKSGLDLMPMLNGASGSIDAMRQQAHDLGLVLSDEVVDSGVEFTDTLDQTKRSLEAMGTQLGGSLMPIITKALKYVQDNLPKIQSFIAKLEPILTSMLDSFLPPLMDMVEQVLPLLMDALEQLMPPISEILGVVLELISSVGTSFMSVITNLITTILPPIVDFLNQILPYVQQFIDELLPPLTDLINAIIDSFGQVISAILPILADLLAELLPIFSDIISNILPVFTTLIQAITPIITTIINAVLPVFVQILNKLMPIFMKIIDAVLPVITSLIEAFSPILEVLFSLLEPFLDILLLLLEPLFDLLDLILPPLTDAIKWFADWIKDNMTPAMSDFADMLGGAVQSAVEGIGTAIDATGQFFQTAWDNIQLAWNGAGEFFSGIWTNITDAFASVGTFFTDTFNNAWDAVTQAFDGVGKFFTDTFDTVSNAVKGAVNFCIDGLNKMIEGLNSIHFEFPSWIPGIGGNSFGINIPLIPRLAKGGLVDEPTFAQVGEAGKEAVIPLENNTKGIELIASKLSENMPRLNDEVIQDKMNTIIDKLEQLLNLDIKLDSGALVGGLAPAMDTALGTIYEAKGRGGRSTW